ncbi:hypothetical protein DPMN_045094 [Dreissena polymorpha]|uniref:Uncharacterized protein n=1 Tax=Dreissena polymorpha TaxID=45954 RepID=A0A9D4D5H6_DREPO|nr:hypothetical protein DPMN_045028 [Dreissena polymorpha]KAH3738460.1 hypothetical protein DPMN_045094 [Dreissena polymorpha]
MKNKKFHSRSIYYLTQTLALDCAYEAKYRDDIIRDKIVFRIKSEKIREKLITEGAKLTLQKATEICKSYDYAQKQLTEMKTEKSVDNFKFRHMSSKQKPRPSAKSESASQQAASTHGRSRPSLQNAKSSRLRPQQGRTCENCTTDNALPMENSVTSARSGTTSHPNADLGMSTT